MYCYIFLQVALRNHMTFTSLFFHTNASEKKHPLLIITYRCNTKTIYKSFYKSKSFSSLPVLIIVTVIHPRIDTILKLVKILNLWKQNYEESVTKYNSIWRDYKSNKKSVTHLQQNYFCRTSEKQKIFQRKYRRILIFFYIYICLCKRFSIATEFMSD